MAYKVCQTPPTGGCPRGCCHWNPNDPNAPEYGKAYKMENNSQLAYGTNIDVAQCARQANVPRVTRSNKTRQDYI